MDQIHREPFLVFHFLFPLTNRTLLSFARSPHDRRGTKASPNFQGLSDDRRFYPLLDDYLMIKHFFLNVLLSLNTKTHVHLQLRHHA